MTRKLALAAVLAVLMVTAAVPAGAGGWTERVTIDAESHTGGSGTFYFDGIVVVRDGEADGTIEYYHPHNDAVVANPEEARLRLVNLQCATVEPSTTHPGDYNILVVGQMLVLEDEGNEYGEYAWGSFVYAPDEHRFGGSRPFGFGVHEEMPSCDLEKYFYYTTPPGLWHTAGYFDAGTVDFTVR